MSARHTANGAVMAAWALLLVILALNAACAQDIAAAASAGPAPSVDLAFAAQMDISAVATTAPAAAAPVSSGPEELNNSIKKELAEAQGATVAPAGFDYGLSLQSCSQTCPSFLDIVVRVATRYCWLNPGTVAGFLRVHFHDCYADGCNGSLMLDITPDLDGTLGPDKYRTEKLSEKNERLRKPVFAACDEIKEECERRCPGKVSAADILGVATWACLKTLPPYWGPGSLPPPVCGRKDSLTSLKEVAEALPGSTEDPSRLVKDFEAKGFTKNELAVLVGVHTLGQIACEYVQERITSDAITRAPDKMYLTRLIDICKLKTDKGPLTRQQARLPWPTLKKWGLAVDDEKRMSPGDCTPNTFDSSYYTCASQGKAPLLSDSRMVEDPLTRGAMQAARSNWVYKFARAWSKLATLQPLAGTPSEIRRDCRCPNPPAVSDSECTAAKAQAKY